MVRIMGLGVRGLGFRIMGLGLRVMLSWTEGLPYLSQL